MEKGQWLVGIDIGGTSVKLAFLTETGDILHTGNHPQIKLTMERPSFKILVMRFMQSLLNSMSHMKN